MLWFAGFVCAESYKKSWTELIAAEYCSVKVELVKDFQMGFPETTPEFLKMRPMEKVKVIGYYIFF